MKVSSLSPWLTMSLNITITILDFQRPISIFLLHLKLLNTFRHWLLRPKLLRLVIWEMLSSSTWKSKILEYIFAQRLHSYKQELKSEIKLGVLQLRTPWAFAIWRAAVQPLLVAQSRWNWFNCDKHHMRILRQSNLTMSTLSQQMNSSRSTMQPNWKDTNKWSENAWEILVLTSSIIQLKESTNWSLR